MRKVYGLRREYLGFPRIEEPYADLPVIPMGVSLGDPNAFDFNEPITPTEAPIE